MKLLYNIIFALGYLCSSGSYGMEASQTPAEQRREATVHRAIELIESSVSVNRLTRCFFDANYNISGAHLAHCLAIAKGVHKAREQSKDRMDRTPSTSEKSGIAALGKGAALACSFLVPGEKLIWTLRALTFAGFTADVIDVKGEEKAKAKNTSLDLLENAEKIVGMLKHLKNKASPPDEWFDKKNEHLTQLRQLIKKSQHRELQTYLNRHGEHPAVRANLYKLQLLAVTTATKNSYLPNRVDNPVLETTLSSLGAAASAALGNVRSLGNILSIAFSNIDGGVTKLPTAIGELWKHIGTMYHSNANCGLLIDLRNQTLDQEIITAQQQIRQQALEQQLRQAQQEMQRRQAEEEEDRAQVRELMQPEIEEIRRFRKKSIRQEQGLTAQEQKMAALERIMKRSGMPRRHSL